MSIARLLNVLALLINRIFVALKQLTLWKQVIPITANERFGSAPLGVDDKALDSEDLNIVNEEHAMALQQIETYIFLHNRLF